jgi:hypothetical protein
VMSHVRVLLSIALLIAFAGAVLGLAADVGTNHLPRLQIEDAHQDAVRLTAAGAASGAVSASLSRSEAQARTSSRLIHLHAHLLNMALLAVLCGLLNPIVSRASGAAPRAASLGLFAGMGLFPLGLALLLSPWPSVGAAIAAAGAIGVTGAVGLLLILVTRPL